METALSFLGMAGGLLLRFGFLLVIPVAAALLLWVGIAVASAAKAVSRRAEGLERIQGMYFKRGLFYAPEHLWVAAGGGSARVGIDDLARRLLPDVCEVRLPEPGQALKKGEVAAEITCGGKRIALVSPADGTVARVNRELQGRPELLSDAYRRGWLFELRPTDPHWARLLEGEAAEQWFRSELQRLFRFAEAELGAAAADGGEFLLASPQAIPEGKWDALLQKFLRAQ